MALAAFRYASSSVADRVCASAMLSKLALTGSSGSQSPASTSRSSRSWMACAYSARLRRWKGRLPGSGASAAAASRRRSRVSARFSNAAASGRRGPGGGIMPARSLRTIRSATSACSTASRTSNRSRDRLPRSVRSLWHVLQVPWTTRFASASARAVCATPAADPCPAPAARAAADAGTAAGPGSAGAATSGAPAIASTTQNPTVTAARAFIYFPLSGTGSACTYGTYQFAPSAAGIQDPIGARLGTPRADSPPAPIQLLRIAAARRSSRPRPPGPNARARSPPRRRP